MRAASAVIIAALAAATPAFAQGLRGVDGNVTAQALDGTAADGDRFYEWDCDDAIDPGAPATDRVRGWCDGTGAGDPTFHFTLPSGAKANVPLNPGAANQNPGSVTLDEKGEIPVGTGSGGAAGTMKPGSNGQVKVADSSGGNGWADKYPLILDQLLVKTSATDRGATSSPSDDPDLTFTATANMTYVLVLSAGWRSAGTSTDLKIGWNIPSGTVDGNASSGLGTNVMFGRTNADATTVTLDLINNTLPVFAVATVAVGGSGGAVALYWSGSSGSGTCELAAGSTLLVYRKQT